MVVGLLVALAALLVLALLFPPVRYLPPVLSEEVTTAPPAPNRPILLPTRSGAPATPRPLVPGAPAPRPAPVVPDGPSLVAPVLAPPKIE